MKRYWFRVPDDLELLMSMKRAELRCYIVVVNAIQRDRNEGRISITQVAKRARISRKTAQEELVGLVGKGHLCCDKRPGTTTVYRLPFSWEDGKGSPVRDEPQVRMTHAARENASPLGEQYQGTPGDQHRTPGGDPHLEFPESSESAFQINQQHHRPSEAKDDVALEVERVLSALRARACIGFAFTASVRSAIRRKLEIVSAEQFERAILLGCVRKVMADINHGAPSVISSLEYFNNLIDEVRNLTCSAEYGPHLENRLVQWERQWMALKGAATQNGRHASRNDRSSRCQRTKSSGSVD
jgi:hypothetical protein